MVHSFVKISHTHLGLHLQRDAMWTLHVHSINEKSYRMLRYKVRRKTLVKVYFALIRPVVEYLEVV